MTGFYESRLQVGNEFPLLLVSFWHFGEYFPFYYSFYSWP